MRDFTPAAYRRLLLALRDAGYRSITMEQYCTMAPAERPPRFVILRHDVDLAAPRSLDIARVEHELGMVASYYFRIVPESNQPDIIRAIAALGHEIGYHYEDMAMCDGDVSRARVHFDKWLTYFRTFYPVRTICMHGAPTSKWDGRDLWLSCSYRDYGVVGEPYFDVDFDEVFYLTDTGRMWDGYRVSVRDKVPQQDRWIREGKVFHTTDQIIQWLNNQINDQMVNDQMVNAQMVNALMITTHPQRWCAEPVSWCRELLVQRLKNIVKLMLIRFRR